MVRTQIQLRPDQHKRLRRLAAERGVSMAELIRQGVDQVLGEAPQPHQRDLMRRSLQIVGKFRSDKSDVSERHDQYLAEAYSP